MEERKIGQFDALNSTGRRYTVYELEEFELLRDINGNLVDVGGEKRLALSTGEQVNPREDGSFEIFETGEIIRRQVG